MVSPESVKRFKTRIRELTGRNTGRSLEQLIEPLKRYLTGWKSYYRLNQWQTLMRDLNRWIRRRLRSVLWKQWKTGSKRFKELRRRGVSKDLAAQTVGSCHKQWRISCSPALSIALPNRLFVRLAYRSYRQATINITEPPYTDPYVRWCGRRLIVRSAPIPILS